MGDHLGKKDMGEDTVIVTFNLADDSDFFLQ
jgi:hypothetical protein